MFKRIKFWLLLYFKNSIFSALNVECWMLNVECWMLNVECWMLNVECYSFGLSLSSFLCFLRLFLHYITEYLVFKNFEKINACMLKQCKKNRKKSNFFLRKMQNLWFVITIILYESTKTEDFLWVIGTTKTLCL